MSIESGIIRDSQMYYEQGMQQLDLLVVGEQQAKTAILVANVLRSNYVFGGPAGGGKTTLSQDAYRMIEEPANDPSLALFLSGQHDLSATQLVGGEVATDKVVMDDSNKEVSRERSATIIQSQIDPDAYTIAFDEVNLADPDAMQAFNSVLENRELRTSAGNIQMPNLVSVGFTLNPTGRRGIGFDISERMASRVPLGAVVGDNPHAPLSERLQRAEAIRNFTPKPEAIRPITNAKQLEELRDGVLATPIVGSLGGRLDDLAIKTVDALRDEKIVEDTGRMTQQAAKIAKALGLMTGEHGVVSEKEVNEAFRYIMSARMLMLKKKTNSEIDALVHSVTGA